MSACNCPDCYKRRGWEASRMAYPSPLAAWPSDTAMDQARRAMMNLGDDVKLPPPGRDLTDHLVADVLEGLRVFNTLHGLGIPEALLLDRARNIANAILGNYEIKELPHA